MLASCPVSTVNQNTPDSGIPTDSAQSHPALAGAPTRSAPAAKINASKSKEMQGKELAFPWIPLVESGLFNGLQRIQIKKSRGPRFLQFVSAIASCPRSPDSLGDPDQSGEQQQYSTHSDFRKDNVRARAPAGLELSQQGLGTVSERNATSIGRPPPIGRHFESHSTEEKDSRATHSAAEKDQIRRRRHHREWVQDAIRSHF
jgi:hypothetical protein